MILSREGGHVLRSVALLLLELVCAAAFLIGIWFIFWPAALIVGGLLGMWACGRASTTSNAREARQ